jgi:hypothetical protein
MSIKAIPPDAAGRADELPVAGGYSAGTWTPTWLGSGSNPTITYTVQTGLWTRVGNVVFISCVLTISASAGGAGTLRIGGLPFTVGATEAHRGGCHVNYCAVFDAATAPTSVVPVAGQVYAELVRRDSTEARDNISTFLVVGDLGATTTIYFSGFYLA